MPTEGREKKKIRGRLFKRGVGCCIKEERATRIREEFFGKQRALKRKKRKVSIENEQKQRKVEKAKGREKKKEKERLV